MDLSILKKKNINGKYEEIDYLYNFIEDLVEQVKWKEIDEEIKMFLDDGDFSFQIYVSFLTATYRAKHKFKNRKLLWQKAIDRGKEYLTDKQVQSTLKGLE